MPPHELHLPVNGFDLDFHELSRIGVTGQVTAMAFFPIFMYLHPTAFLPRMWLIANFAVCQSFSHARTREDTVAGLLMVTIGVVLGQILELHMRRMHQARLEIEAAAEDAKTEGDLVSSDAVVDLEEDK